MDDILKIYLQMIRQYEKLSMILNDITTVSGELKLNWKTESGRLYEESLNETQQYIQNVISDFNIRMEEIKKIAQEHSTDTNIRQDENSDKLLQKFSF